jgi:hypothetical protein
MPGVGGMVIPNYFSTRWNTNGPNIPSFHCSIIPIVSEANYCPFIKDCFQWRAPFGVSNPEMRIFVQGQGNQALVRRRSLLRRTSKRAD